MKHIYQVVTHGSNRYFTSVKKAKEYINLMNSETRSLTFMKNEYGYKVVTSLRKDGIYVADIVKLEVE